MNHTGAISPSDVWVHEPGIRAPIEATFGGPPPRFEYQRASSVDLSLATGDLTTMMLHTRLPIGQLVDWADQAALMVVVASPGGRLDPRVRCLRSRGIRTGTDLLAAVDRVNRPLHAVLASFGLDHDERVHSTRLIIASVYGYAMLRRDDQLTLPVDPDQTASRLVRMIVDQVRSTFMSAPA